MLDKIIRILTELLLIPWPQGISPLVYIEKNEDQGDSLNLTEDVSDEDESDNNYHNLPVKRLKLFRRYPWKRQNTR